MTSDRALRWAFLTHAYNWGDCSRAIEVAHYNVVCATTNIVDPDAFGPPTGNFFATRFLPAHLVNELADVAVIHGGQGTVQTAVWAGTPVVGIGMQWEQQANLDGLVRAGAGVRLPLYRVTREMLLGAVKQVLAPDYRDRVRVLEEKVRASDGAAEAVRQMNAFVRSS